MKIRPLIFLALIPLLTGCVPSKSTITDFSIPIYQDYISPITVPIQPEYKPASVYFEYSTIMDSSITEKSKTEKKSSSLKMEGNTNIRKLGELLIWDTNVNKMLDNGKSYSPSKSLISIKLLTDRYGEIQEFELSSPALESSRAAKAEVDKFIELMRKNMKSFGAVLSSSPVRTGDTIRQTNMDYLVDSMEQINKSSLIGDSLNWIVKGWGIHNKKKVIVTSVDSELSFQIKGNINVQMRVNGYTLFDPSTFQIVESKMLMVMNTPYMEGNSFSMKILSQRFNKLVTFKSVYLVTV